jgi:hypothetical protein
MCHVAQHSSITASGFHPQRSHCNPLIRKGEIPISIENRYKIGHLFAVNLALGIRRQVTYPQQVGVFFPVWRAGVLSGSLPFYMYRTKLDTFLSLSSPTNPALKGRGAVGQPSASSWSWDGLGRTRIRALAPATSEHPIVEDGKEQKRQDGGTEQAADDYARERALYFGSRGRRRGHGDETETGDERGHQDRPQSAARATQDRFPDSISGL